MSDETKTAGEAMVLVLRSKLELAVTMIAKLKEGRARLLLEQLLQQPDAEAVRLRDELQALYRGYVQTLEAGRDRILSFGGDCDPVDRMEAGDPALIRARAVIHPAPEQLS